MISRTSEKMGQRIFYSNAHNCGWGGVKDDEAVRKLVSLVSLFKYILKTPFMGDACMNYLLFFNLCNSTEYYMRQLVLIHRFGSQCQRLYTL